MLCDGKNVHTPPSNVQTFFIVLLQCVNIFCDPPLHGHIVVVTHTFDIEYLKMFSLSPGCERLKIVSPLLSSSKYFTPHPHF